MFFVQGVKESRRRQEVSYARQLKVPVEAKVLGSRASANGNILPDGVIMADK